MSEFFKLTVAIICSIEQMTYLVGAIWLIGWRGWSPWWMLFAVLCVCSSSPSVVLKALKRE